MKRICLFFLSMVSLANISNAQAWDRDVVQPGTAKGFYAGYTMAMLPNTDDNNAGPLLQYKTTFTYAAGLERLKWVHNNFGLGYQFGFHQTGQDYTGTDTITKYTLTASTRLNYIKGGIFLYFRSYNRYNPQAKFRFNCYIGPYFGITPSFNDNVKLFDAGGKLLSDYNYTITGGSPASGTTGKVDLRQPIYNLFDWGFAIAPGIQMQITKKFALGLNIRADLGAGNVENTGNIKKKVSNPTSPTDEFYDHWSNLQNKYRQWSNPALKDKYNERPSTKNFTAGAFISAKWYLEEQF
jgi:opacity protein-like surface antigen